MSAYCKNCVNAVESNPSSGKLFCKVFPFPCDEILGCSREPKTQTNADRIRVMTDEELAVVCEDGCPPNRECPPTNREEIGTKSACQQCWLEWLKQEVG